MNMPVRAPHLLVYGTGGHAKIVVETIRRQGLYEPVALLDDDPARGGKELLGIPILGGRDKLGELRAAGIQHCFVAIGDNLARRDKLEMLLAIGFLPVRVVDPGAALMNQSSVCEGSLIAFGAFVGIDASVGRGCIVSVHCTVGHDCVVEDYAHLAPGTELGGWARIGAESFLGLGANVLPSVCIGRGAVIGAGATVVHDIPDYAVATGVPARIMRFRGGKEPYGG